MLEDGSLKRLQLGARLEAQLVHEGSPRLTVSLQRLGLATCAIEREHELTPRALPQRLLRDERSRVADDLVVVTRGKLEVDAILDRRGSRLLQAADLRLGDRFQRHVGQRRPAPQRQGLGENRGGLRQPPVRPGATGGLHQLLEAGEVELVVTGRDQVAGRAGQEDIVAGERLAELGDVNLQGLSCRAGSLLSPQRLHEMVAGHDTVGLEEESGEERALLGSTQRDRMTFVIPRFQRPKYPKFHRSNSCATVTGAARTGAFTATLPSLSSCGGSSEEGTPTGAGDRPVEDQRIERVELSD